MCGCHVTYVFCLGAVLSLAWALDEARCERRGDECEEEDEEEVGEVDGFHVCELRG